MSQRIAVGVDAGGTATVAALSRDGAFVSSIRDGPGNASSLGTVAAAARIVAAVRAVAHDALPDAVFVAAAGAGRSEVRDALAQSVADAFPHARVAVDDDLRVALRAGLDGGDGIVLIAGTGSVAYAERGETRVRAGGAGYLLGDEGSAFAIGMAAVRLLARVYDGRAAADETTAFAARVLDAPDRDALLRASYAAPLDVARIAGLAPSIIAFAGKGNRVATKIVQTAATELGDLVRGIARQAALQDASPPVVFAGGLLRENTLLSFLLETRITNELPGAAVLRVREEPARAALRFAEALPA